MLLGLDKKLTGLLKVLVTAAAATFPTQQISAQEAILGEIRMFGFNFCPRGWASASGQLLPISSNTALFSLYGTNFGGDGRTTFALPDLRDRHAMNFGSGPGLQAYQMGQNGGAETHSLQVTEMPSHSHTVNATNTMADQRGPGGDFLAYGHDSDGNDLFMYHDGPINRQMNSQMIANTGGSQPFPIRPPYLAVNFCVAVQGIFPSRN